MKSGFVLLAGILGLLYLASRRITTQTSVQLDYGRAIEENPAAASQLDVFLNSQVWGGAPWRGHRGDDETAFLQV